MKFINTFIATTLWLSSLTLAYSSSNLIQVSDKDFKQVVIESEKFTFVDFYADWCRHCKKLAPTIEELADLFKNYPQVQIAKINGDADGKKMGRKYVYQGYPTLLFFHGSKEPVEFNGSRDLESLSNFIQQLSGIRLSSTSAEEKEEVDTVPVVENKLVKITPETFNDTVSSYPYAVVSVGATWCRYCQELKPNLDILANTVFGRDSSKLLIGYLEIDEHENEQISGRYGVETLPTLLFFKDGNLDNPLVYKGDRKFVSLVEQLNKFTNLSRDSEGNLTPNAGVLPEISQLIKANTDPDSILSIFDKLDTLVVEEETKGYYDKILYSILKHEGGFLQVELNRINDILTKEVAKLDSVTIDSLNKRSNILRSLL
ncbi:uncharacterized protein SPAPADRAFT_56252 [Spathaspora passalidarum NRRL Y-27907]|uniref:protein disulfide-isomerase n=1 Tax=Spathaspora passalidarum (strain NRRL Y-27907 / 11-Y1) TaxID=619300 RepID=G3AQ47_SPAPN|nr:uncharacterized protein SPAPADRAFT_56252 [Spathaspora passalidarum NRRL Y-27907]EGW31395.1 hypothetical protein SPAPADRAFT_56252 [Spathaspora passalidarum NRRL Y-27907]